MCAATFANEPDPSNHVCENSEKQISKHIPDVSVVSPSSPPVLSVLCESDSIMIGVSSRRTSRNINQLMGNAELDWADIKSAVWHNPVAAQVVSEHMSRCHEIEYPPANIGYPGDTLFLSPSIPHPVKSQPMVEKLHSQGNI